MVLNECGLHISSPMEWKTECLQFLDFSTEVIIAEGNEYAFFDSGSIVQSSSCGKYGISLKFLGSILKIHKKFTFNFIMYLYFLI